MQTADSRGNPAPYHCSGQTAAGDRRRQTHPRENEGKKLCSILEMLTGLFFHLHQVWVEAGASQELYSQGCGRTVQGRKSPKQPPGMPKDGGGKKNPALLASDLNIPKLKARQGHRLPCTVKLRQRSGPSILHLLLEITPLFPLPLLCLSLPHPRCPPPRLCQFTSPDPFIPLL